MREQALCVKGVVKEAQNETALFTRGASIFVNKLYRIISSKDEWTCWYMADFRVKVKASDTKIRKALDFLEEKGYIVKVKTYPVFWKLRT